MISGDVYSILLFGLVPWLCLLAERFRRSRSQKFNWLVSISMWIIDLVASEMAVFSCEEASSVPSSCDVASGLLSVEETSGSGESENTLSE